jgi:ABC-type phosphate/phosphonate transport system substrate-binding protein
MTRAAPPITGNCRLAQAVSPTTRAQLWPATLDHASIQLQVSATPITRGTILSWFAIPDWPNFALSLMEPASPGMHSPNTLPTTVPGMLEQPTAGLCSAPRTVDRDLETIVLKCLEKDPQRRYGSAEALAEELERWLAREPIVARRASSPERLVRWCQRKPAIAALASSVALLLITVAIVSVLSAWELSAKRKELEALLAIWRADLNRELVELWDRKEVPFIRITSEKRSFLMGDERWRPGTFPGELLRLKFGVYTFEKPVVMAAKFAPLLTAMEESMASGLGRPVRIDCIIYRSYDKGHEGLRSGEVDFMRVGPSSYVSMKKTAPGILLLVAQEDPILCAIFTSADSGVTNLRELEGKSFAFGDRGSTFGTYLAKLALLGAGIHKGKLGPGSRHFRSHDEVVDAVMSGICDAGSANIEAINKFSDTHPGSKVPPALYTFPNDSSMPMPFVARNEIDPAVFKALKDALLNEDSPSVLTSIAPKLTGFREVSDQAYEHLRKEMLQAAEFGELEE